MKDKPNPKSKPETKPEKISADEARGGEIILRSRRRRMIFLGGLIGMVVIAIILRIAGLF